MPIVLTSPTREVAARLEPLANRKTDSELLALADAAEPSRDGGDGSMVAPNTGEPRMERQPRRPHRQLPGRGQPRRRFNSPNALRWSYSARRTSSWPTKAAMLVEPSTQGDGGTFFVHRRRARRSPAHTRSNWRSSQRHTTRTHPRYVPQVVLAKEHYNRLVRMCEQGEKLKMAVDLSVQFHDEDLMAYNTVAEIPAPTSKTRSSCWAATWTRGTAAPAPPTTGPASRWPWRPSASSRRST